MVTIEATPVSSCIMFLPKWNRKARKGLLEMSHFRFHQLPKQTAYGSEILILQRVRSWLVRMFFPLKRRHCLFVEIEEFSQPEALVRGDWKVSQGNHSQRRVEFLWAVSCLNKQPIPNPPAWPGSGTTLWDQAHCRGRKPWAKKNVKKEVPGVRLHDSPRNNMAFPSGNK